ncbi:MAG: hypothetical protein OXE92_02160 [Bacteroidetes bacterium]|nr:hypothetical protein [Bacteroidota bacterium]MCY4204512.1 hypothetical protein [Bacteroidota bacterium]
MQNYIKTFTSVSMVGMDVHKKTIASCIRHAKIGAILNADGAKKNDCERNASKRLIEDFRREQPHLQVIVLEDGIGLMPCIFGNTTSAEVCR